MTPLELTAKASRNLEAAQQAKTSWVVMEGGTAIYEMESERVARAFAAGMGRRYTVAPASKVSV